MKDKLGLKFRMPVGFNASTFYDSTDRNTCIDWCMSNDTNSKENKLRIYESWFSDHKPLWLEIGDEANFN